jgi:hypothetical protein
MPMPTPSPPRKRRASELSPAGTTPHFRGFPLQKKPRPFGNAAFWCPAPSSRLPSLPRTKPPFSGVCHGLSPRPAPAPAPRSRSPRHRCKEKCKVSDFFTLLRKHSQLTDSVIVTDTKFLFPPDNVGFLYTFPTTHFFRKSFPIFSTVSFPEGYNSIPLP